MANARATLGKPASGRYILLTLVLGLLINLAPWSAMAKFLWPDFIAMLLLYWIIHQPRQVGLGSAWFLGLLMDIADGVLFGQHALAYALMAFVAQVLHRRIQTLSPWQQSLYIFALLFISLVVMLLARAAFGAAFPSPLYFVSSVVGAVLWPMLSLILRLPQQRRLHSEDSFSKHGNK